MDGGRLEDGKAARMLTINYGQVYIFEWYLLHTSIPLKIKSYDKGQKGPRASS